MILMGRYQSGQLGRTVTPLTYVFVGSNPALPTFLGSKSIFLLTLKWNLLIFNVLRKKCGSSSVDRASAFQAEGRGFEPRLPLSLGAVMMIP